MSNLVERPKGTRKKSTFSNCEDCSSRFEVKRKWQKYCSRKCKFRYWAKMNPRVKKEAI